MATQIQVNRPLITGLGVEGGRRLITGSLAAGESLPRAMPVHDPVDLASYDSFPASDPPAWIYRQTVRLGRQSERAT